MSPTLADTTTNDAELEDVIDEVQRAEIIAMVRIQHFKLDFKWWFSVLSVWFRSPFQENEFNWVLKNEVHNSLRELAAILSDCISKFPMALCGLEKGAAVEKFVLNTPSTTPPEQVQDKHWFETHWTNWFVTGLYLYRWKLWSHWRATASVMRTSTSSYREAEKTCTKTPP